MSNPVAAALTVPLRPVAVPNPNPNDLNPHSNPKRNAWNLGMSPKRPVVVILISSPNIRSQASISVCHGVWDSSDIRTGPLAS